MQKCSIASSAAAAGAGLQKLSSGRSAYCRKEEREKDQGHRISPRRYTVVASRRESVEADSRRFDQILEAGVKIANRYHQRHVVSWRRKETERQIECLGFIANGMNNQSSYAYLAGGRQNAARRIAN